MNEERLTPGPWEVRREKHDIYQVIGDGWVIVTVAPLSRAGGVSEAAGNANLIAAAPELYDALEDTHLAMSSNILGYNGSYAAKRNAEVLKKARGVSDE